MSSTRPSQPPLKTPNPVWQLANPARFMQVSGRILPWLTAISVIGLIIGLYLSFFVAPEDYQQGQTVRIMFIHVPAAWIAMFCYVLMSISAIGTLVWKHPLADVAAKSAAPIGAVFTFLALVTGSLWGKPMWGTWWVWDARLTSVLVLLIIYLGLIALWHSIDNAAKAARLCAILILVGLINIPIIKFSVDWWNTLHQPASVFREGGSSIHSSILMPLFVMAISLNLLFVALHLYAMRTEIKSRKLSQLQNRIALSQRAKKKT